MKNALILHGTFGHPDENWFPWLKEELEKKGYKVWVPLLPQPEKPNMQRYNQFIFNSDWKFDSESVLIGHSSGAVAILGILQELPADVVVDTCILVGSFKDTDPFTETVKEACSELFTIKLDFGKIKKQAKRFIFVHSDDDPYCPLAHAEYLAEKLNGELIVKKGQKHFSVSSFGPEYRQVPFLLDLL